MCSLPAHNPCVPFTSYISGGVNVGTRITVRGLMPHHGHRFTIDLQCGSRPTYDDIALHMSVRPSEFSIVRNSYQGHHWGMEERFGSCPIHRGHPYDIEIIAEYNKFIVRINGAHFCEFHHRIPLQMVNHVHVAGDTALYYVGQDGGYSHGSCGPPPPPPCPPIYVTPQPVVVTKPSHSGPLLGAAVAGGLIGLAAAAASRPGHHHHHHHHGGGGHHHHHGHWR